MSEQPWEVSHIDQAEWELIGGLFSQGVAGILSRFDGILGAEALILTSLSLSFQWGNIHFIELVLELNKLIHIKYSECLVHCKCQIPISFCSY